MANETNIIYDEIINKINSNKIESAKKQYKELNIIQKENFKLYVNKSSILDYEDVKKILKK